MRQSGKPSVLGMTTPSRWPPGPFPCFPLRGQALRRVHSRRSRPSCTASRCLVGAPRHGPSSVPRGQARRGHGTIEKSIAMDRIPPGIGWLGYAYGRTGNAQRARAILAELKQMQRKTYIDPYYLGITHLGLGEKSPRTRLHRARRIFPLPGGEAPARRSRSRSSEKRNPGFACS